MATIQTVMPDTYLAEVWGYEIRDAVAFKHGSFEPCIRQMQIEIHHHGLSSDWVPGISVRITHGDAVWAQTIDPDVMTQYDKRATINARIADWHENDLHAFEFAGD